MSNELIKRIDDWLPYADEESGILASLLRDCRAEIASLHEAAQQQAVVIERLSKPYVPMTDDEFHDLWFSSDGLNATETLRYAEAEFIKRAGLEIKHD